MDVELEQVVNSEVLHELLKRKLGEECKVLRRGDRVQVRRDSRSAVMIWVIGPKANAMRTGRQLKLHGLAALIGTSGATALRERILEELRASDRRAAERGAPPPEAGAPSPAPAPSVPLRLRPPPDLMLAIDFGTTHTAAAVLRSKGTAETLEIEEGERRITSPVWIGEDGTIYSGPAAQNQRVLAPERYVREPKSRLGRTPAENIGGVEIAVTDLVGAVLARVLDAARRRHGDPDAVRLTHPAEWGDLRIEALAEAADAAGIDAPLLVPEPEAAAFALATNLAPGERLAVYDLGGGTFDTAALERTEDGFALMGPPGGKEVGGERFDDRLLAHVGKTVSHEEPEGWQELFAQRTAAWARRATNLRQEIRIAKEELSHYESQRVLVPFDSVVSVLVQRPEFEELIEDDVKETFELLEGTIQAAGIASADLEGVYLTGGSSRIRLVEELARQRFDGRVFTNADPKAVVALGALSWEPSDAAAESMIDERGRGGGVEAPKPQIPQQPGPPTPPPPTSPRPPAVAPPGWFPDPGGRAGMRYWDGNRWGDELRPFPPPRPSR